MGRGDRDDDARLADVDAADAMVDGDLAELVPLGELRREIGHDLLGHPFVGLVLEVDHLAAARARASRPDERRDRARGVGREPRATAASTDRASAESRKSPPETGGITATSSPAASASLDPRTRDSSRREGRRARRPARARATRRPRSRRLGLDLDAPGTRSLAEPGEQSDANAHANEGIRRLPPGP